MDAITTDHPTDRRIGGPRLLAPAVATVGSVLTLNGVLGAALFVDSRPYSDIVSSPIHLVHYAVWMSCLIALSQIWPRLSGWSAADGRSIPTGVVTLAAVGAALDACPRFVQAFVNPYLANHDPALLDSAPDSVLLIPLLAFGVIAMAGVAAVAISGLRRRVLPRGAAVLLGIGGVAIPVLGPLSNVLVGAALVWIASAHRYAR